MKNLKYTDEDLKNMHGQKYVDTFEIKQYKSRIKRLLPYFSFTETDRVVDFACGNGMLLELISNKISQYVGVDFSEEFIKAANKRQKQFNIQNANFVCNDIKQFSLAHHNEFDCAFSLDFSEHVYDEEWLDICKSIKQTIKPGGKLYIHTPNADFILEKLKNNGILKQFPEHIAVRDSIENKNILKKAGFTNIQTYTIPHYILPLSFFHIFSYLPLIGKFFKARLLIIAS